MLLDLEKAGRSIDYSALWGDRAYEEQGHVTLIIETGLAQGSQGRLDSLTDKGREWLDLVRDDDVWITVTSRITSTVGSVPMDLLGELVRAEIEARLRRSTSRRIGFDDERFIEAS